MKIVRDSTGVIHETAAGRYLVINAIAHDPTYLLTEVFEDRSSEWHPLVCAPFDDQRVAACLERIGSDGVRWELPLPQGLPEPVGREPGTCWVQYRNQRIAAWGPGHSLWQRLRHRFTGWHPATGSRTTIDGTNS